MDEKKSSYVVKPKSAIIALIDTFFKPPSSIIETTNPRMLYELFWYKCNILMNLYDLEFTEYDNKAIYVYIPDGVLIVYIDGVKRWIPNSKYEDIKIEDL